MEKQTKEEIAESLHNHYEDLAVKYGWNTQDNCKVKFADLPEKNKQVMLGIAEFVEEYGTQCRKEGFESSKEKVEEGVKKAYKESRDGILLTSEVLDTIKEIKP